LTFVLEQRHPKNDGFAFGIDPAKKYQQPFKSRFLHAFIHEAQLTEATVI
jgi:hypothetical protein